MAALHFLKDADFAIGSVRLRQQADVLFSKDSLRPRVKCRLQDRGACEIGYVRARDDKRTYDLLF